MDKQNYEIMVKLIFILHANCVTYNSQQVAAVSISTNCTILKIAEQKWKIECDITLCVWCQVTCNGSCYCSTGHLPTVWTFWGQNWQYDADETPEGGHHEYWQGSHCVLFDFGIGFSLEIAEMHNRSEQKNTSVPTIDYSLMSTEMDEEKKCHTYHMICSHCKVTDSAWADHTCKRYIYIKMYIGQYVDWRKLACCQIRLFHLHIFILLSFEIWIILVFANFFLHIHPSGFDNSDLAGLHNAHDLELLISQFVYASKHCWFDIFVAVFLHIVQSCFAWFCYWKIFRLFYYWRNFNFFISFENKKYSQWPLMSNSERQYRYYRICNHDQLHVIEKKIGQPSRQLTRLRQILFFPTAFWWLLQSFWGTPKLYFSIK